MSDPKRIKQIIINLLGNAFKFTLKGSIKVQITSNRKNVFCIKVIDTGIGIRE